LRSEPPEHETKVLATYHGKEMNNIILTAVLLILGSASASAQFYTITKEKEICPGKKQNVASDTLQRGFPFTKVNEITEKDSIAPELPVKRLSGLYARKVYTRVSHEKGLPSLTIPNLYAEIVRNGIRHPKVVLAQAILETGWFRSSACRKQNNLFGLTNPHTGKYYEFNHWTESVRAYMTKVQYRFCQMNKTDKSDADYLKWLHRIGYAEDPRYIQAVRRVMNKYL